jgi:hypothetical protein
MMDSGQYEVLNPWAEVDPVPLKGISPRLTELEGKKIGLFANGKRASKPIMTVVEAKLKERLPNAEFSWFFFRQNREVADTPEWASFEDWVKTVDTVVSAIGD